MDEGYQGHFRNYTAEVPCCQVAYSLNDLVYEMPAGFARYSLGALYPSIDTLTISQLEALAAILGCNVRQIWQRI